MPKKIRLTQHFFCLSRGQSELHYRGEKMRGNTKGEMWKDKDIKWEKYCV